MYPDDPQAVLALGDTLALVERRVAALLAAGALLRVAAVLHQPVNASCLQSVSPMRNGTNETSSCTN